MSCKLIITTCRDGIMTAMYENGKPVELHFSRTLKSAAVGNIYIGRVKDVVKNLQAAFLELGNGQKGYYQMDGKASPFYTKKGSSSQMQQGDELLVQIKKEAVKTKDPVLTTEISISSVYFVGIIGREKIACSGKIYDERRLELINWAREQKTGFGLIIRTNAQDASWEELERDLAQLTGKLGNIKAHAPFRPAGTLLYKGMPEYLTAIKNMRQSQELEILTDDSVLFKEIEEYLTSWQPRLLSKLTFYKDRLLPLDKLYAVEGAIEEALSEKIWLKCGGYLIIQETEALTVVDVNSGKCAVKKNQQETFLKVNTEAALEMARQLRLRNISGIIIVDFINLQETEKKQKLMEVLDVELKKDPIPAKVVDLTALGLVEITRKRMKGTIKEQLGEAEKFFH